MPFAQTLGKKLQTIDCHEAIVLKLLVDHQKSFSIYFSMVRQLTEKVKWIRCFGIENYSCIWVASFLWNAFEKHCSVSRKASNQLQLATSFLYQLHWSRIIERNHLSIYEKGNLLTVADDFKRMTLTKQKKNIVSSGLFAQRWNMITSVNWLILPCTF